MGRFSLAGSLGFVALIAFGFAAVRTATDFWLGATFVVSLGFLCASVLGAVVESKRGDVWWLGFAIFGWAYVIASQVPSLNRVTRIPSGDVAVLIYSYSNPSPGMPPVGKARVDAQEFNRQQQLHARRATSAPVIGHWLFVLIFGRAGATVSCVFTKGLPWRRRAGDRSSAPSEPEAVS